MFQEFTGLEYLKIDIANNMGLDKLSWQERLDWFNQNESKLSTLINEAEEPALFYAGIKAYYDVLKGLPIGYMISLDATASGLQLLAVLTGDRLAASLCNVIDTGDREDAYTIVYDEMCARIGDTSKIVRGDAKQAVMTSLYGSTAVPKQVFGEGQLLTVFYKTMQDLAPATWEMNEAFLSIWDDTVIEHSWTLPDNFHVQIKVMDTVKETVHFLNQPFNVFFKVNMPVKQGRSLGANTIHSIDGMVVREMHRRCNYNPKVVEFLCKVINEGKTHRTSSTREKDLMVITLWSQFKKTGYLSARIIDYLDGHNLGHVSPKAILELLDTFPKKPFEIVTIHDCFRCLPHYGNDLRRQYNLQLQLIARSNLLEHIIHEIMGVPVQIGKMDPKLERDIIETNYALS